jgi:hypothetical protein
MRRCALLNAAELGRLKHIAFAKITGLAKSLEIIFDCFAAKTPSQDVIDVQLKTRCQSWARSTRST